MELSQEIQAIMQRRNCIELSEIDRMIIFAHNKKIIDDIEWDSCGDATNLEFWSFSSFKWGKAKDFSEIRTFIHRIKE